MSTIADLGANTGIAVRFFAALYPSARIVAAEPDPGNAARLRANVRALHGVDVAEVAVAPERGTAPFFIAAEGWASSLTAQASSRQVEVSCVRLADLLDGAKVDLLKVDIEGAEWPLLEAGDLQAASDCIVGEAHFGGYGEHDLLRLLDGFDVTVHGRHGATARFTAIRRAYFVDVSRPGGPASDRPRFCRNARSRRSCARSAASGRAVRARSTRWRSTTGPTSRPGRTATRRSTPAISGLGERPSGPCSRSAWAGRVRSATTSRSRAASPCACGAATSRRRRSSASTSIRRRSPKRGIRFEQGDQSDPKFLERLARTYGPFDVVIDDGSHIGRHTIATFEGLWPAVRPGGFSMSSRTLGR